MTITINTKFDIDDIVYIYWNGKFTRFRVYNIIIERYDIQRRAGIEYQCALATEGKLICTQTFMENELHTKEEFIELLEHLTNDKEE